jgi:polyhydroxybutyrate depolymerase
MSMACFPRKNLSSYAAGGDLASDATPVAPSFGSLEPLLPPPAPSLDAGAVVWDGEPSAMVAPAVAAGDASCEPACNGTPGAMRGKSTQSVRVGDRDRSFIYYAPERLDPNDPAPILIVAHGFSVSSDELFAITRFDTLADSEGFLLIFPNGQGAAPWNVGQGTCPSEFGTIPSGSDDDQAFLDRMLEFVEADRALDRQHVFVSGFASGGYFANETGCSRTEVRAIASHSGGSHDLANCASERKPVILFHGELDSVVPVECGVETRRRWAERNGCGVDLEVREVLGGRCEYSVGCPPEGQVALCLFSELGAGWAGGDAQPGIPRTDFASAAELTWEFFRQFAW